MDSTMGWFVQTQFLLAVILAMRPIALGAQPPLPRSICQGHASDVACLAFGPDGTVLASGSWDRSIKLWKAGTGELLQTFVGHTEAITSVSFNPNGTVLASVSKDGTVRLWDVATGKHRSTVQYPTHGRYLVRFRPNGQVLVTAIDGKTVRVWTGDVETAPVVLDGHEWDVCDMAISPDGNKLVSGDWHGRLRLWDLAATKCTVATSATTDIGTINCLALSPDGKSVAIGDSLVQLGVCTVPEFRYARLAFYPDSVESIDCLAFHPNGALLAVGVMNDNCIELWDVAGRRCMTRLRVDCVRSLVFSPDGASLAANDAKSIKIWDIQKVMPTHKPRHAEPSVGADSR